MQRLKRLIKRMIRGAEQQRTVPLETTVRLMDDRLSGWFSSETGAICEGYVIRAGDVVVDVGCGDGYASEFAARRGARVIATDVDQTAIDSTSKRLKAANARDFQCLISDSDPLPLPDSIATKVICREVLEHVPDPDRILAELVRVGKPGAQYLITVPDTLGEQVQRRIAPHSYWNPPNHVRIFDREEFAGLLTRNGLSIERRIAYSFYRNVWWFLFWAAKQDLSEPEGPLLKAWTETWHQLISDPQTAPIKQALDEFAPKSQGLIARKAA